MPAIGILTASDEELQPFIDRLGAEPLRKISMVRFLGCRWAGHDLILAYSGVGKVNAAIAAELMAEVFHVDAMINAGTAGGMADDITIMDTVVSESIIYHDMADDILTEFHPWLPESRFQADPWLLGLASSYSSSSSFPIRFGTIATGETFIEGEAREEINRRYHPLAVDMESAAVAHACYVNSVPFISVRTITDDVLHEGIDCFDENCAEASARSAEVVLGMLSM